MFVLHLFSGHKWYRFFTGQNDDVPVTKPTLLLYSRKLQAQLTSSGLASFAMWLWPATDHEPRCWNASINKNWRRTESTPRSGWWCTHMAGIYSDCSTCKINNNSPMTQWSHTHTRLMALFPGLPGWAGTRRQNQSGFYWSKRQWVAVASTGPYTSLHLAPER